MPGKPAMKNVSKLVMGITLDQTYEALLLFLGNLQVVHRTELRNLDHPHQRPVLAAQCPRHGQPAY